MPRNNLSSQSQDIKRASVKARWKFRFFDRNKIVERFLLNRSTRAENGTLHQRICVYETVSSFPCERIELYNHNRGTMLNNNLAGRPRYVNMRASSPRSRLISMSNLVFGNSTQTQQPSSYQSASSERLGARSADPATILALPARIRVVVGDEVLPDSNCSRRSVDVGKNARILLCIARPSRCDLITTRR